ncbi:GntR family transcriptional regulator [Pigmentiphaga soli]|uniref:GntR family transcriptional regulator n=1 Tax=Pigmentiphaga soli TaxID=1007095 RepID=A0ABP8HIR9_9BURK
MSQLIPLEAPASLAHQAFGRIVAAIVNGEIAPGEIIKEARIARQLNISRGPLREAMGRLEGHKLVERIPNIGVRVVALSREGMEELFELREALEGLSCRLAATRMTDGEIDDLARLIDGYMSRSGGPGPDEHDLNDEDFHFRIVRGSRNGRLINLLCNDIYYQVRVLRHQSARQPRRLRAAHEEHLAILAALRTRNPAAAEAAMRRHIGNARAVALGGAAADQTV